MTPLVSFVNRMREAKGPDYQIPDFDPLDGGIEASVLFLKEAPGPRAVQSGFISRNNPDETAKNHFLLTQEAGIDRRQVISWNAVPWYIGSGAKIRPARSADVREADRWLEQLLSLLGKLQAVVFMGKKALHARHLIKTLRPDLKVFELPHTSPLFVNRLPGNRALLLIGLQQVREHMNQSTPSTASAAKVDIEG